ncbi:unnamed protein product [Triticum turgidum subsp. durum]|uniref:Alpha-galactosidase n=2 Tax=Triticum TaxID=4564 RepID=A0A9R0YS89_TRITD|nr:unnamed protein product [Triticum turgidum subsp. durum]
MAMAASPRRILRAALLVLLASSLIWSGLPPRVLARQRRRLAMLPPRGWNSYDSFSWTIDEAAFLHNAQIMADKLLPHGYQYAVIDFLWYRKNANGSGEDSYGFDSIDQWGRPFPDPERFPSSAGGEGFKHVADKVHAMGLKFGIHLMNGISTQAVNASTPILDVDTGKAYVEDGRRWTARDIGLTHRTCAWMSNGFMSVNTDAGAGRAFLRSLYRQYADWGVDFVKLDCIFGTDYSPKEIMAVSETLKELERPVILSISPGTEVTPALAENITQHVDMYRITGDDWDSWKDVRPHFDVARSFADANKIGATGLQGRSWPDLDMLPFGRLTDAGVNQGPHRSTNLTFDEQLTQMLLWSMAKSPLMFGGDLRHLNDDTLDLITHPTLLKINHHTKNNMEFGYIHSERTSEPDEQSGRSDLTNNGGTVLGLSTCNDKSAGGWHSSSKDHICRSYGIQNDNASFCMSKAKLLPTSDGVTVSSEEDQAKFHLVGVDSNDGCLDASVSPMFSTCEQHSKQVWELTENGQLKSSYSGLCATMKSSKEGESETTGARAWTATGDKGEIYLAFFNLDTASRKIAVRVPDLEKAAGRKLARKHLCTCTEVWSGKSRSLMKGDISEVVSSHGSILFEIQC